ncbi:acyltransferase family protein [Streptomyces sp. AD55]|uniref:acyltransferase family protein n=1 Tax=Streptomyces sp. AD55 TaxID=3242895 RepID=UPI0035299A77
MTDTLPSQDRAAPSGARRDPFFDNAKYLAIVLVAMGHAWDPLNDDSRVIDTLYTVLYVFHMPAFIIVSGYFSRSFDMRPDRLRRLVTGVAVPYVVFETAYALFQRYVAGYEGHEISLMSPWYLTWFLCALFVWRLTTPLWKTIRQPLAVSLVVAMLASVSPSIGYDLGMQRLLQFLPCFVLGLCLRPEHFTMVRRRAVRVLSVPVFAAALLVGWFVSPNMDVGWIYRNSAAQDMGAPWWIGPVMVLALFGCSVLLTACFFAWVPGRHTWFTALGAGTLYGYLLHGFLIKAGYIGDWYSHPALHRPLGEIALTVLAAVAVTLMCTAPVRRVLRCVTEPRMKWAFRRDAAELARERAEREPSGERREKVSA